MRTRTGGKDELARRVDRLAAVTPAYEPGERWEYSNANYEILGRLIEVVSGQDYQTYVAANILEPVGMEHSFVADGEIHESMATGHRPWFGTKRPLPENATDRGTAPQGGIVASASDLARYMQMMMNGEDDVLSAEGKALMMRPASAASPFYGFGWFVDSRQRDRVAFRDRAPVSRRSRRWSPLRRRGSSCWSTGAADWASGRRPSSATASPPGRSASTTAARAPDGPRRPCSSPWCSCRSSTCSA